ncbi:fec operon regulator FecR [Mariniflexile rhizosphaerae]|uniref:FecR family protein n=1 Tax=unclassified Mariniflexile TaxID=2643887 RepID=UPI000E32D890|nr:FecR family protein [Mariniflexile sp. TRM1-10]AXP80853.1 fec operon regulator FecR [Mariniflexile sp. TRM1-10]
MENSNKIKSLSKKLAASLIKNESCRDFEKSDFFDKKTKEQMLLDIKEGKRLSLLKSIETEKDWKIVRSKMHVPIRKLLYYRYAAVASVLLIVALTIFLNKGDDTPQFTEPVIVNNTIEVGSDKAILTLESGEDVVLGKGRTYQASYVTSNGEEIVYQTEDRRPKTEAIAYNTLTIPRGGQFYIRLSDGTKVWLNSESQLKYPVSFIDGEVRQVELVYGEAYFDVSPSTDHKGAKFKVLNQSQDVEVLGTEFNIKAYKDETHIYTTLVEGKVSVKVNPTPNTQHPTPKVLAPNQQSSLNLKTNHISMTSVDVYNVTSWKDGVFSFEDTSLKDIMKVLSRWYDMDVTIENRVKKEERFIGTFNKSNSIEDILTAIKNTNFINNYEINDKRLIIK